MTEPSEEKRRARLINAVLEQVDVDALIGQVELDELLAPIVDRLLRFRVGVAISGRTPGMSVLGINVVEKGARPAELPAPLSQWLTEHGVSDVSG